MIKEIKINSNVSTSSLQYVKINNGLDLSTMVLSLEKCCEQYCVIVDVVDSASYAAYKERLRHINVLLEQLTKRESEILGLVIRGFSNRVISDVLNISVETVKSHRKKIVSKVGVHKVTDLMNILYDIFVRYIFDPIQNPLSANAHSLVPLRVHATMKS